MVKAYVLIEAKVGSSTGLMNALKRQPKRH